MAAKKAIAGTRAAEERLRDPVEQAKAYLRKKGYVPVATLDKIHIVGCHRLKTDKMLFAFASEKGWGR